MFWTHRTQICIRTIHPNGERWQLPSSLLHLTHCSIWSVQVGSHGPRLPTDGPPNPSPFAWPEKGAAWTRRRRRRCPGAPPSPDAGTPPWIYFPVSTRPRTPSAPLGATSPSPPLSQDPHTVTGHSSGDRRRTSSLLHVFLVPGRVVVVSHSSTSLAQFLLVERNFDPRFSPWLEFGPD